MHYIKNSRYIHVCLCTLWSNSVGRFYIFFPIFSIEYTHFSNCPQNLIFFSVSRNDLLWHLRRKSCSLLCETHIWMNLIRWRCDKASKPVACLFQLIEIVPCNEAISHLHLINFIRMFYHPNNLQLVLRIPRSENTSFWEHIKINGKKTFFGESLKSVYFSFKTSRKSEKWKKTLFLLNVPA